MQEFLTINPYVDWDQPAVREKAAELSGQWESLADIVRACYEYVRDEVRHSGDAGLVPTPARASEVLALGQGSCFAKSHLLAALLRANHIPAALCYQRLLDQQPEQFVLHGLNSVFLPNVGWYRLDARGNKPGIQAQFCPPVERLAWAALGEGEKNYPQRFAHPIPAVVKYLDVCRSSPQRMARLPDSVDQEDLLTGT